MRWRTDLERWRIDFIGWRTGRWRTDTLAKRPFTKMVTLSEFLRELQSLIGLLNFACSVVLPGRAFQRRLIDLTIGITCPQHFIRLTRTVKSDICTWLAFLSNFNGSSFFLNHNWITNSSLQLYTHASGSFGYGAVFKDQWFYGPWPDSWKSFNIAGLEFYPIVLSV